MSLQIKFDSSKANYNNILEDFQEILRGPDSKIQHLSYKNWNSEASQIVKFRKESVVDNSKFDIYKDIINTYTSSMIELKSAIDVLREVVSAYKKTLDYNGYYIAFLLNQLSEAEFEKIVKSFVRKVNSDIDQDSLLDKIAILIRYTSAKYTPSDIANLFNVEETMAENLLNIYYSNRIGK